MSKELRDCLYFPSLHFSSLKKLMTYESQMLEKVLCEEGKEFSFLFQWE